jgi:hypothetical protein
VTADEQAAAGHVSLVEIAGLSMSSIRSASPTGFARGFLKLALEFGGHPARLAHRSAATRPGSQWAERGSLDGLRSIARRSD